MVRVKWLSGGGTNDRPLSCCSCEAWFESDGAKPLRGEARRMAWTLCAFFKFIICLQFFPQRRDHAMDDFYVFDR